MFSKGWRKHAWNSLQQEWDLIIIGGGISGAGIYRQAVSSGYKTILLEAGDFACGTSSRSSKLVHGGFRYLKNRQYEITHESVREREKILQEAPNLVTPLGFVLPYSKSRSMKTQFRLGVILYDLMAPKWKHSHLSREQVIRLIPEMNVEWMQGAFLYYDARMDDARMVLRLISETTADGGTALNYTIVQNLLKKNNGQVCGVQIKDLSQANLGTLEINAHVIINATGPWTDQLRSQVQGTARIRPQRGSHLIFPESRLPLQYAVTMMHPRDKRAMFAIPWEGTTIIGTTDLDHTNSINIGEPFCTQQEIDYMLEACAAFFPSAKLCQDDVVSSFAGLRPIVTSGTANPSAESRKHVVWDENGLITVSGGKLSIFRIMAADALQKASVHLPHPPKPMQCFYKPLKEVPVQAYDGVDLETYTYLAGRYGEDVFSLLELAEPQEHSAIEGLANTWAELRFAAGTTAVEHLDDLLLRRVRLGLLLPEGASALLPQIRMLTQDALGWDDTRWDQEVLRYHSIYNKYYSPAPSGCTIQEGE